MKFQVGIWQFDRNPHSKCFLEVARSLSAALRALGHEVECAGPGKQGRIIMFGANNLSDDPTQPLLPDDTIIFNSEQLAAVAAPQVFMQNYIQYRNMTVWDYSKANIAALGKLGITNAIHCPLGHIPRSMHHHYNPSPPTFAQVVTQDIDVLFYGSAGPKGGPRREILDALEDTDLKVVKLFNVYGAERDRHIARAKVVINLHFYRNGVFEIFRVSHLLDNSKCVVNEAGGCDPELEQLARETCVYVARDKIVDECVAICHNDGLRNALEIRGFEAWKKHNFVESVACALEKS